MALSVFAPPPGLSFPVMRRPLWKTLKQEAESGKDNPLQIWSFPRWQYELTFEVLRSDQNAELQYLAGFYNAVGGAAQAWLYNDPTDNAVTGQNFGTGDGQTQAFALARTFGGFSEPVFALNGTPTIFDAGVQKVAGVDYTVGSAGLVSFTYTPALGNSLTWTGSFYWICRFDDDQLELSQGYSTLWSLKKLSFTTVKGTSA